MAQHVNNNKLACTVYVADLNEIIFNVTRLDFVNQIISGTFEAVNIPSSCGDEPKINLTDGRFDIKFSK